MSNSKISNLTSATTPLAGAETLPIVQGGATVKIAANDLTVRNVRANATTGILQITGPVAGSTRVATVPDANFTVARIDASQSFTGNQTLSTGNLIIGTAGKGVNFTANTPAAGMTSQLLNWYEEGTWTPSQGSGLTVVGAFSSTGKYTRNGRNVTISGTVTGATSVAVAAAGIITTNLPFTVGTAGHGNITNAALTSFSAIICTSTNVTSAGAIAATGTLTFSATYFV